MRPPSSALLFAVLACGNCCPTAPGSAVPVLTDVLRGLPLAFEPNRGQADAQTKFVARGAGYRIFLTDREAVLALGAEKNSWVRMRPVGANPSPVVSALDQLPGVSNYLNGGTPSTWHTDIPNYARVLYRDVYPGIDLAYHGNEGKLQYDWIVHPGADLAVIRLSFSGARRVRLEGGELVIETADGSCTATDPAWATLNVAAFAASDLKQRVQGAGTVFRVWTNPGLDCWGVPSRLVPPYDPNR